MSLSVYGQAPRDLWPASAQIAARARRSLAGGTSRTPLSTLPFPVYAQRASGSQITLVDGRDLTDMVFNYTASAAGHAHPQIVAAATDRIGRGAPYGMASEDEISLAERVCDRIDAIERLRFTNSGSEATLLAIRVARAHNGRKLIAKAEGSYHGSHDLVDVSVRHVHENLYGPYPESAGLPSELVSLVVLLPFNDLDGTIRQLDEHARELAVVFVEAYQNAPGNIPASPEWLRGVAAWCSANDVLLAVDEVASFRTSYRGAHADFGIRPDLVCLGKLLGGGFPIGAVGGREDIMSAFDPSRSDALQHAGTFNGHSAAMASGCAMLDILDVAAIASMNRLGERLRHGVDRIGRENHLPLLTTGYGSVGNIHFATSPPVNGREAQKLSRPDLKQALYWGLLERGFLVAARGMFATSVATTATEVDEFLAALADCAENAFHTEGAV
ncbi:MAG TPA: aminotransferase class III-fold pyridoxal phosphate-dependent enzyme [Solirubrobacteraceae bacterium]